MAQDFRAVGDRIEILLTELQARLEPHDWALVQEAVSLVTELYGGGLEHLLAALPMGEIDRVMAEDDLVASLAVLHGLHPLDLEARVAAALDDVRPYMQSHGGEVTVMGIDEEGGALRLRLLGSCDGCPSSSVTLEQAVRQAIEEHAPEIVTIEVVGDDPVPAGTPIALTRKAVAVS